MPPSSFFRSTPVRITGVTPNKGLMLTVRLAALARVCLRLYPEAGGASAAKAPARS